MATSRRRRLDRPSNHLDNLEIAQILPIGRRVKSPGASSQRCFPGLHSFVGQAVVPHERRQRHERWATSVLGIAQGKGKEKQKDTLVSINLEEGDVRMEGFTG